MYLNMRLWQYYPIEMLLNKDGHGPCNVEEAHGLVYEVWDRACNSHSTHKSLADAINSAIDLNLMNDPDFLRPTIQYPLELIEGAFGVTTSPVVTREDEKAMSIDNIAAAYAVSPDSVKKTLLALTKYATVAKSVLDAETARVEVELANACLERDHYSKSLADEINLGNKLGRQLDAAKKEIEALNSRLDAVTKERDDLKMGKDLEAVLTMEFGETTTDEDANLMQTIENKNREIEKLHAANVRLDDANKKLESEVEGLRAIVDQYQASLNQTTEVAAIAGNNPYDVDLGDMENQITASMQEEFLTGAQLALSPQLTKARCQYLISLLNDIQLTPAAAQYDSVRQTVGAITTRYIKFCGEDFNEGFDEKLAVRDQTLAGIEADTFALKEIVDNLTAIGADAEQPSNADIEADIADFIFKRLGNYSLGGLPAHLREHWASIKKRIEQ